MEEEEEEEEEEGGVAAEVGAEEAVAKVGVAVAVKEEAEEEGRATYTTKTAGE